MRIRRNRWVGFEAKQAEVAARLAETQDWRVAAHDYMRSVNPSAYRLAVDEYRGQLRFLLPLTADSRVLNLGCGWGPVALNLAACTACVIGFDHRSSNLRFASARCRQTDITALHLMRGNLYDSLPFADDTFDAVVILDTPEGQAMPKGRVSGWIQRQKMREIRRVLKPSANLIWGVSNKLGWAHPPVVPKQQLRTYWGYIRSLRNAGFESFDVYGALPSHLEPYFILPLNRSKLIDFLVGDLFASEDYQCKLEARGLGIAYELGCTAWCLGRRFGVSHLIPYLFPSYLILAR